MYWVVLSVILLAESWTVFIIGWYGFFFTYFFDQELVKLKGLSLHTQVPVL